MKQVHGYLSELEWQHSFSSCCYEGEAMLIPDHGHVWSLLPTLPISSQHNARSYEKQDDTDYKLGSDMMIALDRSMVCSCCLTPHGAILIACPLSPANADPMGQMVYHQLLPASLSGTLPACREEERCHRPRHLRPVCN